MHFMAGAANFFFSPRSMSLTDPAALTHPPMDTDTTDTYAHRRIHGTNTHSPQRVKRTSAQALPKYVQNEAQMSSKKPISTAHN